MINILRSKNDVTLIALGMNLICFEIVHLNFKISWNTIPLPGLRNVKASQQYPCCERIIYLLVIFRFKMLSPIQTSIIKYEYQGKV